MMIHCKRTFSPIHLARLNVLYSGIRFKSKKVDKETPKPKGDVLKSVLKGRVRESSKFNVGPLAPRYVPSNERQLVMNTPEARREILKLAKYYSDHKFQQDNEILKFNPFPKVITDYEREEELGFPTEEDGIPKDRPASIHDVRNKIDQIEQYFKDLDRYYLSKKAFLISSNAKNEELEELRNFTNVLRRHAERQLEVAVSLERKLRDQKKIGVDRLEEEIQDLKEQNLAQQLEEMREDRFDGERNYDLEGYEMGNVRPETVPPETPLFDPKYWVSPDELLPGNSPPLSSIHRRIRKKNLGDQRNKDPEIDKFRDIKNYDYDSDVEKEMGMEDADEENQDTGERYSEHDKDLPKPPTEEEMESDELLEILKEEKQRYNDRIELKKIGLTFKEKFGIDLLPSNKSLRRDKAFQEDIMRALTNTEDDKQARDLFDEVAAEEFEKQLDEGKYELTQEEVNAIETEEQQFGKYRIKFGLPGEDEGDEDEGGEQDAEEQDEEDEEDEHTEHDLESDRENENSDESEEEGDYVDSKHDMVGTKKLDKNSKEDVGTDEDENVNDREFDNEEQGGEEAEENEIDDAEDDNLKEDNEEDGDGIIDELGTEANLFEKPEPSSREEDEDELGFDEPQFCILCAPYPPPLDPMNVRGLLRFVTENGTIISRKHTGTCAKHQRKVNRYFRQMRQMGLVTFKKKTGFFLHDPFDDPRRVYYRIEDEPGPVDETVTEGSDHSVKKQQDNRKNNKKTK